MKPAPPVTSSVVMVMEKYSARPASARDPGQELRETREALLVVLPAPANDLAGLVAGIDVRDLAGGVGLVRVLLVGQEVVAEPVHEEVGQRAHLPEVAVDGVSLEDGHDLVVYLVAV